MNLPGDDVRRLLGERTDRVIVGVTGPPGAGKSTLARALIAEFAPTAAYLPMDGFHLSNTQLVRLGRRDRKGAPDTFDVDGFVAALRRVSVAYGERDVYVPEFDRAIEESIAAGLVVGADARLVVTEGNYLALWPDVRDLLDRIYYLDVAPEVLHRRLVERHIAGGRSAEEAEAWVERVDQPNAVAVAATRPLCDVTLAEG